MSLPKPSFRQWLGRGGNGWPLLPTPGSVDPPEAKGEEKCWWSRAVRETSTCMRSRPWAETHGYADEPAPRLMMGSNTRRLHCLRSRSVSWAYNAGTGGTPILR